MNYGNRFSIFLILFFIFLISPFSYTNKDEKIKKSILVVQKQCKPALGTTLPYTSFHFRKIESVRDDSTVVYYRTNRTIKDLYDHLPPHLLQFDLLFGKRILDAGTGDGRLVYEMRDLGIEAIGLDLVLNDEQVADPYGRFVQSDMAYTPFAQNSFDGIYSIWSVLTYEVRNTQVVERIVKEFYRILKPGGFVRIGPIKALGLKSNFVADCYAPSEYVYYDTLKTFKDKRTSNIHTRGGVQLNVNSHYKKYQFCLDRYGGEFIDIFRRTGFDVEVYSDASSEVSRDVVIQAYKK